MNAGECYQAYCALRAHFTKWTYDYHKYHGCVAGVTPTSYEARKEKPFFERIAKQADPFGILLANLSEKPWIWIGDIDPTGEPFIEHRRCLESLTYHVKQQVLLLGPEFDANFTTEPGRHPRLIKLLLAGIISLQTASMLVELTGCGPYWKRLSTGDSFFTEETRRIVKYAPFMDYDRSRMRKEIVGQLTMI